MKYSKFVFFLITGFLASVLFTKWCIDFGLDWKIAVFFNQHDIFIWMASPFVLAGMIVPFMIIGYYYSQRVKSKVKQENLFYLRALYSFISTYIMMTLLKVFTNRVDMEPFEPIGNVDFSGHFRFGFMNSNSWWESFSEGWPSGHTLIAVGMAIAIHSNIKSKLWKSVNVIYPILIGLSVSTAFHWMSDVITGAILGIIIGLFFSKFTPKNQTKP